MSDENYPEQINEIIQKMTAEKTFSADVMAHFLGLKTIADGQSEVIKDLEKQIEKKDEVGGKLIEERGKLSTSLEKANVKVVKYKKEAKGVRKTKRELKVTLLETKLIAEQNKNAYIQECLRIMFKNPVYQEGFSKSVTDNSGGAYKNKTETGTKDRKVQE